MVNSGEIENLTLYMGCRVNRCRYNRVTLCLRKRKCDVAMYQLFIDFHTDHCSFTREVSCNILMRFRITFS
jgi:hypothetical protein